jgi:alanyl-tRNA synthetase
LAFRNSIVSSDSPLVTSNLRVHLSNKLAHTAEHAFIGSLQKILGSTLTVRKVEHYENVNRVIVELQHLDLQTVNEAEREVNSIIYEGRRIKKHYFKTLSEARNRFPNLRANEDRIKETNQPIRIVEIEGHDVAACAMDHASNLHECEFFLVTRMARIGREDGYEINYVVQNQAKEVSLSLSWKMLSICHSLGANTNTVEDTVNKLIEKNNVNAQKLKRVTSDHLCRIQPKTISHDAKVDLILESFCALDDEEIRSFVGRKTSQSQKRTIVLIVNMPINKSEYASFVLARTENLDQLDCKMLLDKYSTLGIKGGGRPAFVTGIVNGECTEAITDRLIEDILSLFK